jgi:hypothetical protein
MINISFLPNTKGTNVHANALSGTQEILATFALMELRKQPWAAMAFSWPVRKRSIVGSDQFIPRQTDSALLTAEFYFIPFQANQRQYGHHLAQFRPHTSAYLGTGLLQFHTQGVRHGRSQKKAVIKSSGK